MISLISGAAAVSDLVSGWQKLMLLVALTFASSRAIACITMEVVLIADAAELREYFDASARSLPNSLDVNLTAGVNDGKFGGYRGSTLKVLPVDLAVEKLANEQGFLSGTTIVTTTGSRSVRFSLTKGQIARAFVVMLFNGPGTPGADIVEVRIPYSAFQALVTEKKVLYPMARAPDLMRTDFLAEIRGNLPN